jgi:predicted  nucleic acid-binding Zn-ribbon protein
MTTTEALEQQKNKIAKHIRFQEQHILEIEEEIEDLEAQLSDHESNIAALEKRLEYINDVIRCVENADPTSAWTHLVAIANHEWQGISGYLVEVAQKILYGEELFDKKDNFVVRQVIRQRTGITCFDF